jgi:hypothetical protein
MSRSIWKKQGLANRASRSILVPTLAVFLLGWFGLGFSLQAGLCTHAVDKAAMHGSGLCTWLCAAHGQDLIIRSPELPSILSNAGLLAHGMVEQIRPWRLETSEGRGPPNAIAQPTLSA